MMHRNSVWLALLIALWWCFVGVIVVVLVLLFVYWLRRHEEETALPLEAELPGPEPVPAVTEEAPPRPLTPDDLKVIEGIGPKISGILQAAGIATFAQLAQTDASRLRAILDEAGLRLADPTTWPEQASLAAKGDWEGLKALQSQLKGGRRV